MPASLRLAMLHAWAVEYESSGNILQHHWGLHLLSDWKSLSLLEQTGADEPTAAHEDGTP